MFDLQPPRHISTLHFSSNCCNAEIRELSEVQRDMPRIRRAYQSDVNDPSRKCGSVHRSSRDDCLTSYSITASAMESNPGGTSMSSARAV